MPFPARFPGTCARTGARINPGDPIVTVSRGRYALATDEPRRVSDVFEFGSGAVLYRNRQGRCEDAPCCGCCTF
jgi:hypothetical protein